MALGLGFRLHSFSAPEVEIFLIKVKALEPGELRLPIQQLDAGFITLALQRFEVFGERVRDQSVLGAGVGMFLGGLSLIQRLGVDSAGFERMGLRPMRHRQVITAPAAKAKA